MKYLYQVLLALIYFIQFSGIIYFNKHSDAANVLLDQKEPGFIAAVRTAWVLLILIIIGILTINPLFLDVFKLDLNYHYRILGIFLGVIVDILLFWTLFSLGKNISTTLSVGENHRLVITGPYKYVRHPMYTLGIFLFFSLMLISSNWLMGIAGILFQIFVMIFRTPLEERMLVDHFGSEYSDYQEQTGKFFPKVFTR